MVRSMAAPNGRLPLYCLSNVHMPKFTGKYDMDNQTCTTWNVCHECVAKPDVQPTTAVALSPLLWAELHQQTICEQKLAAVAGKV